MVSGTKSLEVKLSNVLHGRPRLCRLGQLRRAFHRAVLLSLMLGPVYTASFPAQLEDGVTQGGGGDGGSGVRTLVSNSHYVSVTCNSHGVAPS